MKKFEGKTTVRSVIRLECTCGQEVALSPSPDGGWCADVCKCGEVYCTQLPKFVVTHASAPPDLVEVLPSGVAAILDEEAELTTDQRPAAKS